MGYYTYFSLTMYGDDDKIEEVQKAAVSSNNEIIREFVQLGYIEAKWYDFKVEFPEFCKGFPDVLFIISGDGEESDDVWEMRCKGDKSEIHYVSMPPFTTPELLLDDEKQNNNN